MNSAECTHDASLQGRLAEAVDAYERALAAAPNFEIVRNNLAIALTELGTRTKLDGASHWLQKLNLIAT